MSKTPNHNLFIQDLQINIRGDVLSDDVSLGMYATDASLYQIIPVVVVLPRDEADVLSAKKIAVDHNISILPRGGGTSLAGQAVGRSMILDFSKYMNTILEFDEQEQWVRVQPGLVRDELNLFLREYGLHFAPDPATSSRANIGGMIGNNSSGTKSVIYGKTVDHVISVKIALTDGSVLVLEELNQQDYKNKEHSAGREGEIYRTIKNIVIKNEQEIIKRFPKIMRRVQGYNLDELAGEVNWNLAKLICGSEGTLATILEAKINLTPLPAHKSVCVVHFTDMMDAIKAVQHMLPFNPAAIEILDHTVIKMSRENLTTRDHAHFVDGNPAAVQIVEFYGDTKDEVMSRPQKMIVKLKALGLGYAYPIFPEGQSYDDVWMIRKKGLGLMLGAKGDKKAIAFIEDASIPIEVLPEYIEKVVSVCKNHDTEAAVYAHASVGVIHVRPMLNMRLQEDIDRFKKISEETFQLVKEYKGSWSGEHGDGLVRSIYLEQYFGPQVYGALKELKQLFDPQALMNPGKIIDAPPIDKDLRYGADYKDDDIDTIYHYRNEGSFGQAVHMCSGVGECRKTIGGTMCPSFKATRDEEHSTRGRANALRLAISGQLDDQGISSLRLKETLDLCLSCKACKSECPSNVDMAKLKSEVLQKYYDQNGLTMRDRLINHSSKMAAVLSGPMAPIVNTIMKMPISRRILQSVVGFDKRRVTPPYTNESFSNWYRKNYKPNKDFKEKVVLFADTYLNYHEPSIGIAAIQLLNKCGYEVLVADVGCCQRPRISHGFLKDAKEEATGVVSEIRKYLIQGLQVVVCEPSCYSALVDDIPDLIDDAVVARELQNNISSLDIFIADKIRNGDINLKFNPSKEKVVIHGHCHQKALWGTSHMKVILNQIEGLIVEELATGCCGMAGSFGYEKEHYDLSKKIADDILIPQINKIDTSVHIVANGFSCRHQIKDLTGRKPLHWVEFLMKLS